MNWAIVSMVLQLMVLLFQEYFSAKGKANAANAQFQLDEKTRQDIINAAVARYQQSLAKNSSGAGDAWDSADQDLKKP